MKRLIVCGDSYMSPVVGDYAGTHYSEILAKELGYELVAYSRGGMSNGGICIQVKTALESSNKSDLILVGTTFFDRLEWPYNETQPIHNLSVEDIRYHHPASLSSSYSWLNKNPKLVSSALADIASPTGGWWTNDNSAYGSKLVPERKAALDLYFEFLYHPDLKKFMDETLIYSIYHQLHESGVSYIICTIPQLVNVVKKCKWLNYGENSPNYADHDIKRVMVEYCHNKPHFDPGYHTSVEAQAKIAELLLEKYIPKILS